MGYIPRKDSWAGKLSEHEQYEIYKRSLCVSVEDLKGFFERIAADYPEKIDKKPSVTSFYQWRKHFAPTYNDLERNEARDTGRLVVEYAKSKGFSDRQYIDALQVVGSRALVANDAKTTALCLKAAMDINAALIKNQELELKSRAQATKEADLALAREKFEAAEKRLNAVKDAVASAKSKGGISEETLKKIEEAAGLL